MRGHPDGETIAAFREDLLPARKAGRIAAHLAECPRCAEVDAQLAAVTAALARTPTPPMPASLAARLDAALAAHGPGRGCRSGSRRSRPPWPSWRAAGTRSRGWSRGVRRRRRPVPLPPPPAAARRAGHPGRRCPPRPRRALPPPQGSRWSPAARRTGRASCRPRWLPCSSATPPRVTPARPRRPRRGRGRPPSPTWPSA